MDSYSTVILTRCLGCRLPEGHRRRYGTLTHLTNSFTNALQSLTTVTAVLPAQAAVAVVLLPELEPERKR
jgi:hypothetical protein